jgi:hypothetical protein
MFSNHEEKTSVWRKEGWLFFVKLIRTDFFFAAFEGFERQKEKF